MHARNATLAAALLALAGGAALAADKTVDRRVAADARGTVAISNVSGRVEIVGWDRAEVEVKGTLDEDVDRVDVLTEGTRTLVKVVIPKGVNRRASAELTVRVPRGAQLEVSTVSADVTARDLLGAQRLTTVSGEVDTVPGGGDVQVKTVSGDVTLRGRGASVNTRIKTVSGDVAYEKGAGSLEVETVSGDTEVALDPATALRVSTTSGSLDFRGSLAPEARVDVQAVSGDLSLAAKAPAGMSAEVETFSGDIGGCLKARAEKTRRYGPGQRLSTVTGEGKAQVRLKTFSGDVRICDR